MKNAVFNIQILLTFVDHNKMKEIFPEITHFSAQITITVMPFEYYTVMQLDN